MTGGYGGTPEANGADLSWYGQTWGGTSWLEGTNDEAHAKYVERLGRWANTTAFSIWEEQEYNTAITDANYAYATTSSASEYWAAVARYWESYGGIFQSLDEAQYRKILAAVGASTDAADTYVQNRKLTTFIEPPKIAKNIPWWVYAIGGLVVFNAIRR